MKNEGIASMLVEFEVTDNDGEIENFYFDTDSLEGAIRDALADGSNDEEARNILLDMLNELNN